MVGNVAVGTDAASNNSTAVMRKEARGRFEKVVRSIRSEGGTPGIQLAAAPLHFNPGRRWRVRDPQAEIARLRSLVMDLDTEKIADTIRAFKSAALRAEDYGFAVIEIHAAHGYLLSLLLDPTLNSRRDYPADEPVWMMHLIREIALVCTDSILAIRLNATTAQEPKNQERLIHLSPLLLDAGVQMVDISNGHYTLNRHLIYPPHFPNPQSGMALELAARFPESVFGFAGGVIDPSHLPPMPKNVVCSIGRGLIANPDLLVNLLDPRSTPLCQRTGWCHYSTRGKSHISCPVSGELGGEQ